MKKYSTKRVCVIWDNATCHKGKTLREKLAKGNTLERLHLIPFPPYAPDHNPIEHVWQYAKKQIANTSGNRYGLAVADDELWFVGCLPGRERDAVFTCLVDSQGSQSAGFSLCP